MIWVRFIIFILSAMVVANNAYSENFVPNIHSKLIDQEKLAKMPPGRFTVDEAGYIIDGPRQAPTEPIDYSEIVSDESAMSVFQTTVHSCVEGVDYCNGRAFRWDTKGLGLLVVEESSPPKSKVRNTVLRVFDQTAGRAGFEFDIVNNLAEAELIVYVGNPEFLLEKLKINSHLYGVKHYERIEHKRNGLFTAFASGREYSVDACYFARKDIFKTRQAFIYLTYGDVSGCLPRAIFSAFGLHQTGGFFPSVTGSNKYTEPFKFVEYKYATYADVLFLKLIYDADYPSDGSVDRLKAHFLAKSPMLLSEIIAENEG